MNVAGRFDWPGLMRLGMGRLGLRPAEFWALTPAELLILLGRDAGAAPMDRAALAALQARYPDVKEGNADDGQYRGSGHAGGGAGGKP